MIVCLRLLAYCHGSCRWREPYLAWIEDGRAIREQHGILAELVCQPSINTETGDVELVVITASPIHEVFDAWVATPCRDALAASPVHQAVAYRPISRHDVSVGYLNLRGLAMHDPNPPTVNRPNEEPS